MSDRPIQYAALLRRELFARNASYAEAASTDSRDQLRRNASRRIPAVFMREQARQLRFSQLSGDSETAGMEKKTR